MTQNAPTQPYQKPMPPQSRRRGCGCLGRALIGGVLLLAVLIFGGIVVAGTLIYANFSREIEDGIEKLETADSRETFETTQILDRNGDLLWEIFGEGKRT
ncbi:MAG: hypothetical protein KC421_21750, partial [Anaerolineales bacterium]|nr:hypothetical protein [Anaerolineales bacterium]